MKKLSWERWNQDVKEGLRRRHTRKFSAKQYRKIYKDNYWSAVHNWLNTQRQNNDLRFTEISQSRIVLNLPETMNFYSDYERTVTYMIAIRKLAAQKRGLKRSLWLASVNFDNLKKISTSAALVLTAELSKWDDALRQKLKPSIDNWNADILKQFTDLGFFDLFHNKPTNNGRLATQGSQTRRLVKYIKGCCGDSSKTRILREEISNIVGESINKWTFLRSGLNEAIINVCHHAYPENHHFSNLEKNWYLSGSYNDSSKELKIVFYDQGIGIPKALPASKIWERVLSFLSILPAADRKKDAVLLKAAVQLERTSTGDSDRGKGLQDLLEFIRQRQEGYLSILSAKGLYKFSIINGEEAIKSEHFNNPIPGTLIIWSANLGQ